MFMQKLINLKKNIMKRAPKSKNNGDADYLEDLNKERHEFILKKPFKNNMDYTIFGIFFIIISLIVHSYNLSNGLSTYLFALTLIIEFIGIALLLPFISELKFISLYYSTCYSIMHILHSEQNEKYDSYLEKFQINYNNLRKQMKKQIISSKGNFLTYDYEIKRIVHEIDTFFDSTTRILFQRKIMGIPYLPIDEFEIIKNEIATQSYTDSLEWDDINPLDDINPPDDEELNPRNYEIKAINFRSISDFMRIYGNLNIKKPRKKVINTIAIAELFRKWNSVVAKLEPEIFQQSKKDVERYYSKKQERQNYLFSKAYEIFIIFLITIISGILLKFFL